MTGRLEPYYPPWKRHVFRWFVSVPIIGLCLVIVFFVMIIILQLQVQKKSESFCQFSYLAALVLLHPCISVSCQDWWDKRIESNGYPFCLSYLPKILLAVVISVLDEAYYKVACWLNDKGNNRLTLFGNFTVTDSANFISAIAAECRICCKVQSYDLTH